MSSLLWPGDWYKYLHKIRATSITCQPSRTHPRCKAQQELHVSNNYICVIRGGKENGNKGILQLSGQRSSLHTCTTHPLPNHPSSNNIRIYRSRCCQGLYFQIWRLFRMEKAERVKGLSLILLCNSNWKTWDAGRLKHGNYPRRCFKVRQKAQY